MERDWIDYANAIGSIATAVTLIWVLLKEYKTRKHITDLAVLASELKEQNQIQKSLMRSQARPIFTQPKFQAFNDGKFEMTIRNKCQLATVDKIIVDDKNATIDNDWKLEVEPNSELYFSGNLTVNYNTKLLFEIIFFDMHLNKYSLCISTLGMNVQSYSTHTSGPIRTGNHKPWER